MAGTRTAPDLTGSATALHLSVHFVDNSGDKWSESHYIAAASTAAQREAYIDALQATSAASIYKVVVNQDFGTDFADAGQATDVDVKSASVFDQLVFTLKSTTNPELKNKLLAIPAPLNDYFITDGTYVSDQIDGSDALLAAVLGAFITMIGAGWGLAWVRYVEKSEVNQRQIM